MEESAIDDDDDEQSEGGQSTFKAVGGETIADIFRGAVPKVASDDEATPEGMEETKSPGGRV